jgi:hypothetical protein
VPVPDIDIVDWDTDPANCKPTDGTLIAGNLAGQIRNIKALARRLFLDAQWERWAYPPTFVDANTFTVDGDHTDVAAPQRPIRVRQSGVNLYGWILDRSFGSGITTVNVYMVSGPLSAAMSEVAYATGTSRSGYPVTPYAGSQGEVVITNAASGVVSFSPAEWDERYHVSAQVVASSGGPAARSLIVRKIVLNGSATGFEVFLEAATGAAKSVTVAWRITRTLAE